MGTQIYELSPTKLLAVLAVYMAYPTGGTVTSITAVNRARAVYLLNAGALLVIASIGTTCSKSAIKICTYI